MEEAPEQRGGDPERGVGDHVVRLSGQAEAPRIGLDDDDRVAEPLAEVPRPARVGFDRNDPRSRSEEWRGDRTPAGADVQDDGSGGEVGFSDEPRRPPSVELVPAPRWR